MAIYIQNIVPIFNGKKYVRMIRKQTDVPVGVGFGISTPEQAAAVCADADGVIVGSAIVNIIAGSNGSAELLDKVTLLEEPQAAFWLTTPERGITVSAPIFVQDRHAEGW